MESMMTARQVAELLGVHENWVYDQAASGALPSYKIGGTRRFIREEVLGYIAEHRTTAREQPAKRKPKPRPRRAQATRPKEGRQPTLFE
jgi:excisionase family DNA binding protein